MDKRFSKSKETKDSDFRQGCQLIGTSGWLKPSRYKSDSYTAHQ